MPAKANSVLSLEDKEQFAEVIRNYPYVNGKYKKKKPWKEIVQKLEFLKSGKNLFFFCIFRISH